MFTLKLRNVALGPETEETKIYKDILPGENPDDDAYVEILKKIFGYTMTIYGGADSTYGLFQIVKYIVQNDIRGEIVECGVWRGGSMMFIAYSLRYFGDLGRQLYLYDTYAGMTQPDDIDVDFDGIAQKPLWKPGQKMGYGGSLEDVKSNLRKTDYPEERLHFIAGDVLETIPAQLPSRIALLRLDTDYYKSTLHELKHLYDLLVPHGVLIVDDYGWCRGARQATDEFLRELPFKPLMHRVDQSVRVIVKPALKSQA